MKAARLNRLFNPQTRRCFDVAVDHGFFNEASFLSGIENMSGVVGTLVAAAPDAIQLTLGQAALLQELPIRPKPALVLRTDVANVYGTKLPRTLSSLLIADPVLQAVRLDAACVVVNLFRIADEPEVAQQGSENSFAPKSQCDHYGMPLMFEPGERWEYGISMDWVGKLVEGVTDQSLEIYFREHIFEPLRMLNTGFLIGSAQKRRVAAMHRRGTDGSLVPEPFEINQRPEFFMGGGGLFSTPRDYMAFLQMLLNGGMYRGERVLRGDTVATMFRNHIGDLQVTEMKTAQPSWSNSFDQFPGEMHKWGLSFDINTQPGPHGRSAGSVSWAGLLNTYFWVDPVKRVAGSIFTQTLPFYDARIVSLYGQFEQALYAGLRQT